MTLIPTIEETMEHLHDLRKSLKDQPPKLEKVFESFEAFSESEARKECESLELYAATIVARVRDRARIYGEPDPSVESLRYAIGVIWLACHRRAQGLSANPFGEEEAGRQE